MKFLNYKLLFVAVAMLASVGCFKDLDTQPIDPKEKTPEVVYSDPGAYKQVLAKLYASFALSGQQGPDGQSDIAGLDEGFSPYIRQYWYAQELTTDEAVIGWNDKTIQDFHRQNWTSQDVFVAAMYSRIFYVISVCNEFIRESTPEKLAGRNQSNLATEVATYRAEARFLRALAYWHALDLFRQPPFVTEEDAVGAFFPKQIKQDELFQWIEKELKEVENQLVEARTNQYGRADRAAAQTLLAKLYLNGKVYTGRDYFAQCREYCQKVIDAGYTLESDYKKLFLADNNKASGLIFPITYDGLRTKTWGGMTFIIHAAVGGNMSVADFGIDFGWGGTRTTKNLVQKFASGTSGDILVQPNEGNTASYPVIYVPGGYQGWDPANTTTVLSSSANDNTFEGYLYFKDDDTQFKFTPGPNWSADYGDNGADGTLDPGGSNIVAGKAGLYKINVNLNALTYTIARTDWGLIGSATPGGWGSDTDMSYDEAEKCMTITLDLVPGEVKFRANDDWGINLGDTGKDAIAEYNGDNIAIAEAGRYRLKLYLDRPDYTYSIEKFSFDGRALFHTSGQSLEIDDVGQFTNGYAITKFRNIKSDGTRGSDITFVDTDFPMFRIEDVYLMYAEAHLRGGGGSKTDALDYVNRVRNRAYKGASGHIADADLTLDFILDERARELYWEGHRRTDLVRYGRFSESTYVWPWKGGVKDGVSTDKKYDIFPIPAADKNANPNLDQNDGY